MKRFKHTAMVAVIGLAMLAQLMSPTLAYADGETTPPPVETLTETPTPEPTETPTETPTESPTPDASATAAVATDPAELAPTEVAATEVLPVDPASATLEPVETSTPVPAVDAAEATLEPTEPPASTAELAATESGTAPVEPTLSEAMQALPVDTSVVVLDESGQVLPLASQETANVIVEADPIWCPEGFTPIPLANGCTDSYASMADLLSNAGGYINSQSIPGRIWITTGAVPDTNPIVIDGSTYSNWATNALTLQGGWSGSAGDTTIGLNSVFTVPITVANWKNTVGIGNITADSITVDNSEGVVILADVESNDTRVNNSKGRIDVYNSRGNLTIDGANINNGGIYSAGINVHTFTGNVTINNSAFHGNGFDGVWMNNVNNVTIDNSQFYENANNGLGIYYANNIFISNSDFGQTTVGGLLVGSNYGRGLDIYGAATVTLNNVTAKNNWSHGISVSNTTGDINLSNITATSDPSTWGDGAYLDNTAGIGNVTLIGISDFSNHNIWNSGMFILSNGNVSLSGITSNNNGRGVNISQAANVTVADSTFINNGLTNSLEGLYISNVGTATLNNVTSNANGNGVHVSSYGPVTLNTLTTDSNFGNGAFIYSDSSVSANGATSSNGNGWTALEISAAGDITLNDVTASGNLGYGPYLISYGGSIALNGTNNLSSNGYNGLLTSSNGPVTLNNLTVSSNGSTGALIYGNDTVTVNGTNSFTGNGWTALEVWTSGAITLNDVMATDNYQWGAYLNTTEDITLNGTHDYSRNAAGILASSTGGAITLNNVTANASWYSFGAHIIGGTNVTVTGGSTFNNNGDAGLLIQDSGNVALSNISAKDNWGHGIVVTNAYGDISLANVTATAHVDTWGDGAYLENMAGSGNVTLIGNNDFSNHNIWNSGMYILSNGNVSLSGITSNNNGRGVNISRAANVTISNGTFSDNIQDYEGTGAFVFATGNVNLNRITSNRSSLHINSLGNVTIDNVTIGGSPNKGLSIVNAKEISLKDVSAGGNPVGTEISRVGDVKITGGLFDSNGVGLYVICANSVSLNLPQTIFTLNLIDIIVDPTCPIEVTKEELPIIVVETQVEGEVFVLDCAMARSRFVVHLANGDRGDINCPVVGNATITRVDNTTLPANLPAGYTYASGFEFKIEKDDEEVIVISEGGYVTASFIASSNQLQPGNSYSILYWDPMSSSWVPLKDYLLNEYRNTQIFDLFPGAVDDTRKILSGVKYFTEAGEERAEVSTNFPGIFVLAQH